MELLGYDGTVRVFDCSPSHRRKVSRLRIRTAKPVCPYLLTPSSELLYELLPLVVE
jgi:hypothetical protein